MDPNRIPSMAFDQDTLAKFQQARAAGVPDEINYKKAAAYQISKGTQTQAPTLPQQPKNTLLDLLPLIGAVGGSFVPGLGTIVGGAAGAGLGTLAKQFIQKKPIDPAEILTQGALAGAGGAVGEGLGFVAGKLLPKVAPGLADIGETLASKVFRVSPGQATKFASETGEPIGQFLAKRGIFNPEALASKIDALQQPFDEIVKGTGLSVAPENILNGFSSKISQLNKSILPSDHAKAKVLTDIASNFIDQYGSGPIPAAAITGLRKEIDQGIGNFALDEAVKGPLNLTRDVLQGSLRDAADKLGINVNGQSLKEAGVELSKLYKAQEIANRQANLGVGSMPLGLTKLLGGAIGGATGGVPGAVTGMAATSAINSPETIGLLAKLFGGASNAASRIPNIAPEVAGNLGKLGVGVGSTIGAGIGGQPAYASDTANPGMTPSPTSQSTGMGEDPQTQALRTVLAQIMFSKAKSVSDIAAAYGFLNPQSKPLTATQQQSKANALSGLRALDTVQSIIGQDPNAPLKSHIPILSARSPYAAAAKEVADVLTRLRTGAALNKEEQAFYESQLPQPFDSPETISYKLNIFRNLFNQIASGQQSALPDNSNGVVNNN